MGRIVTYGESPLTMILTELIKRQKPTPGSNKTETARNEALLRGWVEGMCEGLAAYGTALRVQAYNDLRQGSPDEKWVVAVEAHVVRKWVEAVLDAWNKGHWKDKTDEQWTADVTQAWLDEIVFPEEIANDLESRRRKLVLGGALDPKPEDAEWIAQERESYVALVTPYDRVLQKLGVKAGFQPRPVKDTPQA